MANPPPIDHSGHPAAPPSDLAQALGDTLKRAAAAEDHLAREVRSAQALQERVAELEALCADLGVAPTFRDRKAVFLPTAEVRETTLLNGPEIRATLAHFAPAKFDDHARDRSGCRMCAAAMVLRRASPSDEAEVLLLQRGPSAKYGAGAWTLPAGGVTPADCSLIDTAARELLEETGLILNGRPCVVRLVDGLTPTTGGFPFACAIVLSTLDLTCGTIPGLSEDLYNREPDTHSAARWFKAADIPAETWDREMLIEIMGREEDAHWSNPSAVPNLSITQAPLPGPATGMGIETVTQGNRFKPDAGPEMRERRIEFFRALDNAEQARDARKNGGQS